LCRRRIKALHPLEVTDPVRQLAVEFAGLRWKLPLNKRESVVHCIDDVFQIPRQHRKVLGRGGKVIKDLEALAGHSEIKARLIGTPSFAKTIPGEPSSAWFDFERFEEMVWEFLTWLLNLIVMFFSSMSPTRNARAEHEQNRRSRERERHRHSTRE